MIASASRSWITKSFLPPYGDHVAPVDGLVDAALKAKRALINEIKSNLTEAAQPRTTQTYFAGGPLQILLAAALQPAKSLLPALTPPRASRSSPDVWLIRQFLLLTGLDLGVALTDTVLQVAG